ncbi:hypothetical protein Lal_00034017 [Lupinus albus]|nr:hypothetical protein Lal_00034017 [Lupinus albus]
MEGADNVSFDGDMFKLTVDNFYYWKPMMEVHLYCKDMHEPISYKDKPEVKLDYKDGKNMTEHLNSFKGLVNQLTKTDMKIDDELHALLLLSSLLEI